MPEVRQHRASPAREQFLHPDLSKILTSLSGGFLSAIGPRVEESGLGLVALRPHSAPYEDLRRRK